MIPKFIEVECAVGWPDHTWSDCQYVYLPEDTPDDQIEKLAIKKLEDEFNSDGVDYSFIVLYSLTGDALFTENGDPIDEDENDEEDNRTNPS